MHRLILLFLIILSIGACTCKPKPLYQESYAFGTRIEITIYDKDITNAMAAMAAVLTDLDRLHHKLNAWKADSELSRINKSLAQGKPVSVDTELATLLQQSQYYESLSDNLFNPAIGNLITLWGFHRDNYASILPEADEVNRLITSHPQMNDLTWEKNILSSRNTQVNIDLGGIAKGWALDKARDIFHKYNIQSALINIGGNIMAIGKHPDGNNWTVGIRHPRKNEAIAIVPLYDGEAIGTSGDYQRYFEIKGKKHCHLIDPRDGNSNCLKQAVTVLMPASKQAGILSDVLSKPIYFANINAAEKYAKAFGTTNVLIYDNEEQVWISKSFEKRIQWLIKPPTLRQLAF